jgi:RNA polymerase sigma-70 factor (ECF subfamily)
MSPDALSETELISLARAGDGSAWEKLMQDQLPAVFRLAYLLLGDADDAQDVAQEAFIRAYQALDRFDASRPLRPWLLSITRNLARNQQRSVGRYLGALQRLVWSDPETAHPSPDQRASGGPGPEDAHDLWQAVRRLNRADQETIYLRYFLDLSEAETARVSQVAVGTVKSRTHRALGRLRTVVEREFPSLRESLEA